MHGDDLAHYLRFLYGDQHGLGLAQAARDIGTKPERLREMLAHARDVPDPWATYLRRRVVALMDLTGRAAAADHLVADLTPDEQQEIGALIRNTRLDARSDVAG